MYGGKFIKYDYSKDKDFSGLDTTPHELLDKVPRKSIKEQVDLFIQAGVRLDESRRQAMLAGYGDDNDIPDDLDELETILDKPDLDVQDYDEAITYLKNKQAELSKAKEQPVSSVKVDNPPPKSDNNSGDGDAQS